MDEKAKKRTDAGTRLMIAASERDANMYYASGFMAPDPFICMEREGLRTLMMSDLEVDRAKAQSRADRVLSLSAYLEVLEEQGMENPTGLDALDLVLKEMEVEQLLVPSSFGIKAADFLRDKGYTVVFREEPFFEERALKSEEEVGYIAEAMRHSEDAMDAAVGAIREAEVRSGVLYSDGEPLTAERIKKRVNVRLMENDCVAGHTIVAPGDQACDPHNEGSGPIRIGQPVVIDIFPRSLRTGYCGDITRTIVRGEASADVKRIYGLVQEAQELAFPRIMAGADGTEIHRAIEEHFEKAGYETGEKDGRMQGFFHGTGHGLGLEVHEPPRIGKRGDVLKEGHVVTVEPGLYYLGIGGVRIEDVVVVTESGCRNLTSYPKVLEV